MSEGNGVAVLDPPKTIVKSNGNVQPQRQIRVVEDEGPNACLLDTARFEHMQRIATIMAKAALLPEHLLGFKNGQKFEYYPDEKILGNCFLIVNQALRWGLDPFAVAAETYVVSGKLGFQGKLIAALVNARANLKRRLWYTFDGKGDALAVTVNGHFEGEDEPRTITLSVAQGRTNNSMWTKDPHQKLIYSGVTKWARRHCPEILLGVFTDDDLDRIKERETAIPTKPQTVNELITAANISVQSESEDQKQEESESSTEKEEAKTPVSHFDACMNLLDERAMDTTSGMSYSGKNEVGHTKYKLGNGKILTIGDGADGEGSVNTLDPDAIDQVRNEIEASAKKR